MQGAGLELSQKLCASMLIRRVPTRILSDLDPFAHYTILLRFLYAENQYRQSPTGQTHIHENKS